MTRATGWVARRERNGRITYRVRYQTPDGEGKVETFDRKRDADERLAEIKRAVRRGTYIDPDLADIALGEWWPEWIATKQHLKPKTVEGYRLAMAFPY